VIKTLIENHEIIVLMKLAFEEAERSTCQSRKVGCVIVPKKSGVTIVTHNDYPYALNTTCGEQKECRCFDEQYTPGEGLDRAYALHAEANGIATAAHMGISLKDATLICTDLPCNDCAKLILAAGIKYVYYNREYPKSRALEWFDKAGVICEKIIIEG
jgi:dCMP deaminase